MATSTTTTNVGAQTNDTESSSVLTPEYIARLQQMIQQTTPSGVYQSGESGATYTPEQLAQANKVLLEQIEKMYGVAGDYDRHGYTTRNFGIMHDREELHNELDYATLHNYNRQQAEGIANMRQQANVDAQATLQQLGAMRRNMQSAALNGANAGQVNANILSAYLAGQQQKTEQQTTAMQALQQIAEQRRAELQKNAAESITMSNTAAAQLGQLLNSEREARLGASGSTLYNMGGQAGSMAGATKAKEFGNTTNHNVGTTSPYKQKQTTGAQYNTSTTNQS